MKGREKEYWKQERKKKKEEKKRRGKKMKEDFEGAGMRKIGGKEKRKPGGKWTIRRKTEGGRMEGKVNRSENNENIDMREEKKNA